MPLVFRESSRRALNGVSVWRYLQADAVMYTLLNSSIRFTQVKEFQDHWEGLISPATRRWQSGIDSSIASDLGLPIPDHAFGHYENFNKFMNYVSSWTLNTPDKMLMWQAFTTGNEGAAIEIDLVSLQADLANRVDSGEIGEVTYVDLETIPAPSSHWREELFRKRPAFEHEREVRIVIDNMFAGKSGPFQYSDFPKFHFEHINLSSIKSVQVHPYSSDELLRSLQILARQMNLEIPISRSDIAEDPKY